MSFGIYIIGSLIVIGGLAYGAVLMHVPTHWIVVGAIVLTGIALARLSHFAEFLRLSRSIFALPATTTLLKRPEIA
jgi:hypothetical protein